MALIKSVRGFTPEIGENCFLADNATIIGDVKMGRDCSIWFSTVLRGDVNSIRIGNGVNIQDGSVLHTLYEKSTIEIGDHVSVGHNVTIHGAAIRDYALIGMGSTILDHAVVGGSPARAHPPPGVPGRGRRPPPGPGPPGCAGPRHPGPREGPRTGPRALWSVCHRIWNLFPYQDQESPP